MRPWQFCIAWLALMAPLASWGLPSRAADELLFGGQPAWPAAQFQATGQLASLREREAGADTDLNPLQATQTILDLTASDADRAAILLRYRLYSRQPDEMITFRALARMRPREANFDPQLYQYGGLYVYLAGAAAGLAGGLGFTRLSSDLGAYLAEPELFGRLYVATRCISLIAGTLALAAVFRLAARGAGRTAGWLAMILTALSPSFITFSLEAKPHLPATAALLWAAVLALDFSRAASTRVALRLGALVGVASGLVLTGAAGGLHWATLLPLAKGSARRGMLLAAALALAIYALTNPYVLYNALLRPSAILSNLGNSGTMYRATVSLDGMQTVVALLAESVGAGVLIVGLGALLWPCRVQPRALLALAPPALGMTLLCVALGAGKPAEFARFLLLPALLLCVSTAVGLVRLAARSRIAALVALCLVVPTQGSLAYVSAFATDARGVNESRRLAGHALAEMLAAGEPIGMVQEPAPYATPPLDFTQRQVLLLPSAAPPALDPAMLPRVLVLTADDERRIAGAWWRPHYRLERGFPAEPARLTPIAWANKATYVFVRVEHSE